MNDEFGRRASDEFPPRILSDDEIEMYLKGDRREVDRLILFSLNRLAACIVPHAHREEMREQDQKMLLERLGGVDVMLKRAKFVDASIAAVESRTKMMSKVADSSVTWAFIAFLGFIVFSVGESVVHIIKVKLGLV